MSPLCSGTRSLREGFASNGTGSPGSLGCVLLEQRARAFPYTMQMSTQQECHSPQRQRPVPASAKAKRQCSWICRAITPSRCFNDRLEKEVGSSSFSSQEGKQGSTVIESPKTIRLFVLVSRGGLGDSHRPSGRLSQEPCQMQSRASKRSSLVQVKRRGPWGWTVAMHRERLVVCPAGRSQAWACTLVVPTPRSPYSSRPLGHRHAAYLLSAMYVEHLHATEELRP